MPATSLPPEISPPKDSDRFFAAAFLTVVGLEGGYVNDPQDPGGETKFGISKRRYPKEDIANLTIDRARFLYWRDYWLASDCHRMDWTEAILVFDSAVNGGSAKRWHSMFAGQPAKDFATNFQAEHALYLASLPGWTHDGRGWMRRLITIYDRSQRSP